MEAPDDTDDRPSDFVTDRSATGPGAVDTRSLSLALLFAGVGSVVPDGAVTVAVFVIVPVAVDEIVAGTVKVAVPPGSRLTVVAMSPAPDAGHVEPADATQVHEPSVRFTGAASETFAPTTAVGPALVTTIAYVVVPPAVTPLTPFVFVMPRSACGKSLSVVEAATSAGLSPV